MQFKGNVLFGSNTMLNVNFYSKNKLLESIFNGCGYVILYSASDNPDTLIAMFPADCLL